MKLIKQILSLLLILFFVESCTINSNRMLRTPRNYEFDQIESELSQLEYKIDINENKKVLIEMTLTSPNCPVAESLPNSVKENILKIDGIEDVNLKLVWDPPWTKDKMSEAAKLELNL